MIQPPEPLSPAQRSVLAWLLEYPGVQLVLFPGHRVSFTHYWACEEARLHMERVNGDLFGKQHQGASQPRTGTLPGRTPRITMPTFEALQRRGLLHMASAGRPGGPSNTVWAWRAYYTISRRGMLALRQGGHNDPAA